MILSVIILNYKKSQLTLTCIASLYNHFDKELQEGSMEVLLVDNNSADGSVELFKKTYKEKKYTHLHLVENNENTGFSRGCNSGAKKAQGNYMLFLNNDTQIQDKSLLDMVKYIEKDARIAIIGGQLKNLDGSLQQSVGDFYTPIKAAALLLGGQKLGSAQSYPSEIARVDWVKGALLMIRADIFKKLNGFDENIFMYVEDMELCYRAKQLGYLTYFYPPCSVIHAEHGSANRSFAIVQIYKSLLYFYKKHRSYGEYLFLKTLLKTKAIILVAAGRILRRPYLINTYEKALGVV